jgi:septum formation protein
MRFNVPFILASRSPRRRHLLTLLGTEFEQVVSDVDESISDASVPREYAERLALEKAGAVARLRPDALVLGADTIVVHDEEILGKPVDEEDARRILRRLSGTTHAVYTGIALIHLAEDRQSVSAEATQVTFAELSDDEIDRYVATGSPMDKAGAYGIQDDQGALYVSRIDGDYYNVVGLPLHRLYEMVKEDFGHLVRHDVFA